MVAVWESDFLFQGSEFFVTAIVLYVGLVVINNVDKLMRMPFSEGEDLSNIEIRFVFEIVVAFSSTTCYLCQYVRSASYN